MDAVELGVGEVQELRRRRVAGLRERVDPRAHQILHAAQRADHQPAGVRRRAGDEVPVGDVAVVVGRQDQVLAALPLVGAGEADVGHVALPDVVDEAQRVRGRLDHRRPVALEVEVVRAVRGLGVRGQHDVGRRRQRIGVGEDVRRGLPDAAKAVAHRDHRRARHAVQEHLDAAHQVQRVIAALHRVGQRQPVEELQRPERRLQPLGHPDRRQHILRHPRARCRPAATTSLHVTYPPIAVHARTPREVTPS